MFTGLLAWEYHDLHLKSRKACNKTRSPRASPLFKGQGNEHTTVKWPIKWLTRVLVSINEARWWRSWKRHLKRLYTFFETSARLPTRSLGVSYVEDPSRSWLSQKYIQVQKEREREIRPLLFTFSIKRKIRQFHVVIFTAKKCTKINVMHLRSRSRCCRRLVVSSTHSLMLFHRSYLRSWSSDLETWFNQLPSALI